VLQSEDHLCLLLGGTLRPPAFLLLKTASSYSGGCCCDGCCCEGWLDDCLVRLDGPETYGCVWFWVGLIGPLFWFVVGFRLVNGSTTGFFSGGGGCLLLVIAKYYSAGSIGWLTCWLGSFFFYVGLDGVIYYLGSVFWGAPSGYW